MPHSFCQGDYIRALEDLNAAIKHNALRPEIDPQVLLYNRAVIATKMGMDHYALADLNKAQRV